jgi:hypothetical protein
MVSAIAVGLASVLLLDGSRRVGWRLRSPDIALAMATTAALLAGTVVCLLEALQVWGGFSPFVVCLSAFSLWLAAVYACRPYPGGGQPEYPGGAWFYLAILVATMSGAALFLPEVRGPAGVEWVLAYWVALAGAPGSLAAAPAMAMIGAGGALAITAMGASIKVAAPIGLLLALVPLLAPVGAVSQDDLLALGGSAILLGLALAGLRERPGRSGALVGGIAAGLGIGSRGPEALLAIPLALMLIVELVRTVSSPRWAVVAVSGFLAVAAVTGLAWHLIPLSAAHLAAVMPPRLWP